MATIRQVVDGLNIFARHCGEDGTVEAQHDIIYAGLDADGLTEEERKTLDSLGWFFDRLADSWAHHT